MKRVAVLAEKSGLSHMILPVSGSRQQFPTTRWASSILYTDSQSVEEPGNVVFQMMLPVVLSRAKTVVNVTTKILPLNAEMELCIPVMFVFHNMSGASGAGPAEKRVKDGFP